MGRCRIKEDAMSAEPLPIPPRSWSGAKRLAEITFVSLVLALGLALFPLAVMGTDLTRLPGTLDVHLQVSALENGYEALQGRSTLQFGHANLGSLPVYALFRLTGFDRETSFQIWFLFLFVLNFLSAYLALRWLKARTVGAAAGAYGFAFGLPLVALIDHAALFQLFPLPFVVLFACRVCHRGAIRDWTGMLLLLAWQFACTSQIGSFLTLFLAFFVPIYLLCCAPRRWFVAGAFLGGCVVLVLLTANRSMEPLPEWQSWLTPSRSSLWRWSLPGVSDSHERQLFLGVVPLASLLVAVLRVLRRHLIGSAALAAGLLVLMTTDLGGFSLSGIVLGLPGSAGVVLVVAFPAALCVAQLVSRLQSGMAGRIGTVSAALVGLSVVFAVAADQGNTAVGRAGGRDQTLALREARGESTVEHQAQRRLVLSCAKGVVRELGRREHATP
jgi:hypothetical protein